MKAKAHHTALRGLSRSIGGRPSGYEKIAIDSRVKEVKFFQTVVGRFLASDGLNSSFGWLYVIGVLGPAGNLFRLRAVKDCVLIVRHSGMRSYYDEIVAPAIWIPVIDIQEHQPIKAVIANRIGINLSLSVFFLRILLSGPGVE